MKIKEKDCYCECCSCGKKLNVGNSIQYTPSGYTTYCDNTECTEGVETIGTCLEYCWWGEESIIWEKLPKYQDKFIYKIKEK